MQTKNINLQNQNTNLLYGLSIDTEYIMDFPPLSIDNKASILSDNMMKSMLFQQSRIKYSCKLLSYFLNVSYEYLLQNLKFSKNELDKKFQKDKGEKADYVARIGNMIFDIEVNNNNSYETMLRNQEYAHRLFAEKVKVGTEYEYSKIIQLNLNNFAFEENDLLIDPYYLQNDQGIILTDKIIIIQIYIPNIRKKWYTSGVESLTELERVLLTLIEKNIEVSKELGKGDPIMEEYIEEAIQVSKDESFGEAYDKEWALLDQGRRDGFEDGKNVGKEEEKAEIVQKMLKEKMDINLIMKVTGLTKKEIEAYQQ